MGESINKLINKLLQMHPYQAKKLFDFLGILLYNNKGEVRDLRSILTELDEKWNLLSEKEKEIFLNEEKYESYWISDVKENV